MAIWGRTQMFDRNNFVFSFCLMALTFEAKFCSGLYLYISADVSGFAFVQWNLERRTDFACIIVAEYYTCDVFAWWSSIPIKYIPYSVTMFKPENFCISQCKDRRICDIMWQTVSPFSNWRTVSGWYLTTNLSRKSGCRERKIPLNHLTAHFE